MKRRILVTGLLALSLMVSVFLAILSSNNGSRWLLQQLFSIPAARVSVSSIEGRLLDRISLAELFFQSDSVAITITKLTLVWHPSALLSGRLKIIDLNVDGINLTVREASNQTESQTNFEAGLALPVQITVDNLLLTDITLHSGNQTHLIKKLQLSAATDNDLVEIKSLTVITPEAEATLTGQIGLGKNLPADLSMGWQAELQNNGEWRGVASISGDFAKLDFNSRLAMPFKLTLQGQINDLTGTPNIMARGGWQNFNWPFTDGKPQIQSQQGSFEVTGLLDNYRITVNGLLHQQYLADAGLIFDGTGSRTNLAINQFELQSATGLFGLSGNIAWQDSPVFDLQATGQHFNPAIVLPELPGKLNFNTHLKGKMAAAALQLDAEIKQLSGQLRGYPVSAGGKLTLDDKQIRVDTLRIASGVNKLSMDGMLGQQQNALNLKLDMPDLTALWPGLGGSLQGQGRFQGIWNNPAVQFTARGKRLRFADNSIQQLAIDIDYHPQAQKNSTLKLTANSVKSGSVHFSKLRFDGHGNGTQHRLTAEFGSAHGNVSAALDGRLVNQGWQGKLSKIDLDAGEAGVWRLKNPMPIHVTQYRPGFTVSTGEGCLVQRTAFLCLQGQHSADGDFKGTLKTAAVPVGLLKSWLPESVNSTAVIHGDAQIQRQKSQLSGSYRFVMPASALLLKANGTTEKMALGASSLSGLVRNDTVSGNLELGLSGRDYLHSRLQLNIGKTQALSGQVSAKIEEFTPLKAFVPQLTAFKGRLVADLTVKGTAKKPEINGRFDFNEGFAETNSIRLRDINLHALAADGRRIQLQGSAEPALIKLDKSESMAIKGIITIDADLRRQKNGLKGHYRLALPARTSITISNHEMVFGTSTLAGDADGGLVTAELNFMLANQDHLRGHLQVDTDKNRILSGHIDASMRDFALLEVFAPQLSSVQGQLTTDLNLSGALQKPQITGLAKLDEGSSDLPGLGLNIREINVQALSSPVRPEQIAIKGSAKSGEGNINLDGIVDLPAQAGMQADLMLTGENFDLARLPDAQIAVSPVLKIAYADSKGKISGTVKVPKALLTFQDIPDNAVKVSDDEIILGQPAIQEKQPPSFGIDADIEVELGKQAAFSGMGLKTGLAGRLKLISTASQLIAYGNVDLVKAVYKRFGQDLTVRKGRFLFNGPADNPWVEVEAIRLSKNKKVTAVLSLTGPLKKPKTQIYSEPPLPETDALAYLITGGPLSQVSKSEGNRVASAALSYGAGQLSWLTGKLSLDEFAVEEGETLQDSLLAVGRYLTPDFYVGTKVGLFNKQTLLILKHKITDHINVETQTGTSQRIKLNYEINTD